MILSRGRASVSLPLRPKGRRRRQDGVSMVEFAFIAPAFLLVLIGVLITGMVVMNLIAFNNALRDVSRVAAVCGSATGSGSGDAKLPDGTGCSTGSLQSYLTTKINGLSGINWSGSGTITVISADGTSHSDTTFAPVQQYCAVGATVKVAVDIQQPLYLPLVGVFLGNNHSTTTRTFNGTAEAKCER